MTRFKIETTSLLVFFAASTASAAEAPFAAEVPLMPDDLSSGREAHLADLDGDGDRDIIFAGGTALWWHENTDGLGAPMTERVVDPELFGSDRALVTDVDGDGDLDIISSGAGLRWYENVENASAFAPHEIDGDRDVEGQLGFGDIDGDGERDVVLADTSENAARWFAAPGFDTGETIGLDLNGLDYVVVADLAGDGSAEVVLGGGVGGNQLVLGEYNGGSWSSQGLDAGSGVEELRSADVDGDGDFDILVGQDEHAVLLKNLGDGLFGTEPVAMSQADSVNYQLAAGDIDGDGDLDLVATSFTTDGGVVWYEADGGEFAVEHTILPEMSGFAHIDVDDADCDGDADVIVFGVIDDLLDVWILENGTNEPTGSMEACINAGDDGAVGSGPGGGDDDTGGETSDGGSGEETGGDDSTGASGEEDGSTTSPGSGDDATGGGSGDAGSNDDSGGGCSVPAQNSAAPLLLLFFAGLRRRLRTKS